MTAKLIDAEALRALTPRQIMTAYQDGAPIDPGTPCARLAELLAEGFAGFSVPNVVATMLSRELTSSRLVASRIGALEARDGMLVSQADIHHRRIEVLSQEVGQLCRERDLLKGEVADRDGAIADRDGRILDLVSTVGALRAREAGLADLSTRQARDVQAMEAAALEDAGRIRTLEGNLEYTRAECGKSAEQARLLGEAAREKDLRIRECDLQIERMVGEIEERDRRISDQSTELDECRRQLSSQAAELNERDHRIGYRESEIEEKDDSISTLTGDVLRLQAQVRDLTAKSDDPHISELRRTVAEEVSLLGKQIDDLTEANAILRARAQERDRDPDAVKQLTHELDEVRTTLASKSAALSQAQEVIARMPSELKLVQTSLGRWTTHPAVPAGHTPAPETRPVQQPGAPGQPAQPTPDGPYYSSPDQPAPAEGPYFMTQIGSPRWFQVGLLAEVLDEVLSLGGPTPDGVALSLASAIVADHPDHPMVTNPLGTEEQQIDGRVWWLVLLVASLYVVPPGPGDTVLPWSWSDAFRADRGGEIDTLHRAIAQELIAETASGLVIGGRGMHYLQSRLAAGTRFVAGPQD